MNYKKRRFSSLESSSKLTIRTLWSTRKIWKLRTSGLQITNTAESTKCVLFWTLWLRTSAYGLFRSITEPAALNWNNSFQRTWKESSETMSGCRKCRTTWFARLKAICKGSSRSTSASSTNRCSWLRTRSWASRKQLRRRPQRNYKLRTWKSNVWSTIQRKSRWMTTSTCSTRSDSEAQRNRWKKELRAPQVS